MAQNPKYSYSEDDLLQPVYCIVCRQNIPKLVSNDGNGICPECAEIAKAVAATTANPQAQSNMQTENETKMDCDQSTDTIEVELESQNNATKGNFFKRELPLFLFFFILAWVLFFVIVRALIVSVPINQDHHQSETVYWLCENCGKTWGRKRKDGKPLQYQLGRCDGISTGIHSLLNRY